MSEKETSTEIATIAGHVLNIDPVQCPSTSEYSDLLTQAKKLAGSALAQYEAHEHLISAQAEGTLVLQEKDVIATTGSVSGYRIEANSLGGLNIYPPSEPIAVVGEFSFGFYIDGYTLSATENIGEVGVKDMAGRECVIKSKALTDFLDRRLDKELGEPTDG